MLWLSREGSFAGLIKHNCVVQIAKYQVSSSTLLSHLNKMCFFLNDLTRQRIVAVTGFCTSTMCASFG